MQQFRYLNAGRMVEEHCLFSVFDLQQKNSFYF